MILSALLSRFCSFFRACHGCKPQAGLSPPLQGDGCVGMVSARALAFFWSSFRRKQGSQRRSRSSLLTFASRSFFEVQSVRLALRASRLLLALPKSNQKARHRTRRSDSRRANRTALRFSGTAGSSESTSMCSQSTRAHCARAPSGNFRRTLRCSAPRTAPVDPRIRASLHYVHLVVRFFTNLA